MSERITTRCNSADLFWESSRLIGLRFTCCSRSQSKHRRFHCTLSGLVFCIVWSKILLTALVQCYGLQIADPGHISNWTVTHVDWSEGKWHPKSYEKGDITEETLRSIQVASYFET